MATIKSDKITQAKKRSRIANPKRFFTFVAIIAIIIAAIALAALPHESQTFLGSAKSILLKTPSAELLKMQNSSTFAIFVASSNSTGATVYVSQLPLLVGYASKVTLMRGASANVSTSASGNADLNIRLVSSNASHAKLLLTPLSLVLGIRPSAGIKLIGPASISAPSGLKIIAISTTTTTSSTTSTINQTSVLLGQALAYANTKTAEGILMNDYKALYEKDAVCNETIYNATYQRYYNAVPSGAVSFANVSKETPINVTAKAAMKIGDLVFVNYTPVFRSGIAQEPMLSLLLNMSANAVTPIVEVTYEGILKYATYAELNSTYAFQSGISNYCGAYVAPP
ncbi:MAG: hypothetical protein ACP5T3_00375 [Candidatus Micrarchaeia archaeon]